MPSSSSTPLRARSRALAASRPLSALSASPATASAQGTLVTTPIFYVNAAPHIGHAYSGVLADARARWAAVRYPGTRVRLTTGTDEHGQKIAAAARAAGKPPAQHCEEVSRQFRACMSELRVGFADYVRTTEPRHQRNVESLWRRLAAGGHISRGAHEGWYCASDEAFVPEASVDTAARTLRDNPRAAVEWLSEPNYVFEYDARQVAEAGAR